jgi:segregation and condensation protein A
VGSRVGVGRARCACRTEGADGVARVARRGAAAEPRPEQGTDGVGGRRPRYHCGGERCGVARTEGGSSHWSRVLAEVEAGRTDVRQVVLRGAFHASDPSSGLEEAVAEWLAVAELVERKARALLPTPPEPADAEPGDEGGLDEGTALAERLAAFHAYAEAAELLRALEEERARQFPRPGRPAAEHTTAPVARGDLRRLLAAFAAVWERASPPGRELPRDAWTVPRAVEALRLRLSQEEHVEFSSLFPSGADRRQVVVMFLAVLELVRRGEVSVEQEAPFGPLRLTRVLRAGGSEGGEGDGGR